MFEVIIWSLLVVGVFAILNRIWLLLYMAAETSRLEPRDGFAEAVASLHTDPRSARTV